MKLGHVLGANFLHSQPSLWTKVAVLPGVIQKHLNIIVFTVSGIHAYKKRFWTAALPANAIQLGPLSAVYA